MTTLDSSPALDSIMEDTSQTLTKPNSLERNRNSDGDEKNDGEEGDDEEPYDSEVWQTLTKSFREVQSLLDRNRSLIQQVNENHQSKIPDNLVKNVSLIQEINGNVSKVMSLYSDLSVNFANTVHQRRAIPGPKSSDGKLQNKDCLIQQSINSSADNFSIDGCGIAYLHFLPRRRTKGTNVNCVAPTVNHTLNGINYLQWCKAMQVVLTGQGRRRHLTGSALATDDKKY